MHAKPGRSAGENPRQGAKHRLSALDRIWKLHISTERPIPKFLNYKIEKSIWNTKRLGIAYEQFIYFKDVNLGKNTLCSWQLRLEVLCIVTLSQKRQITILAHITRDEAMSSTDFPQILQSWPIPKLSALFYHRSFILISLSFFFLFFPLSSILGHILYTANSLTPGQVKSHLFCSVLL